VAVLLQWTFRCLNWLQSYSSLAYSSGRLYQKTRINVSTIILQLNFMSVMTDCNEWKLFTCCTYTHCMTYKTTGVVKCEDSYIYGKYRRKHVLDSIGKNLMICRKQMLQSMHPSIYPSNPLAPAWSIRHPWNASFHISSLILDGR
jgi:hypothetical protein